MKKNYRELWNLYSYFMTVCRCHKHSIHATNAFPSKFKKTLLLLVFGLGSMFASASEWVDCAGEKQLCYVPEFTQVRFGANGSYAYSTSDWRIYCHKNYFGGSDPAPGVVKRCEYWSSSNESPVVTALDTQMNILNEAISLQVVATDPESEVLTYDATNLPTGLSLDASSGLISGTFTSGGIYDVTVEVADASGGLGVTSFNWVVSDDPGWIPCALEGDVCNFTGTSFVRFGVDGNYLLEAFTDTVGCSGSVFGDPAPGFLKYCAYQFNPIPLSITSPGDQVSDVDSEVSLLIPAEGSLGTLYYSALGLPSGLSIDPSSGLITGVADTLGVYAVDVTVENGEGGAETASFGWSVNDVVVGVPPVLEVPNDHITITGESISLSLVASDADGDPLSFTATNLPSGLVIDSVTGLISGVPDTEEYQLVEVTVTDINQLSATVTFRWEIVGSTYWVHCANENGTCSFNGTTNVRYGASGSYVVQSHTESVRCKNSIFGDPIAGVAKTCEYEAVTMPLFLENPGYQVHYLDSDVSLPLNAEGNLGALSFRASGLPNGLSIDASSGLVTGTVTEEGSFLVTVVVSNGVGGSETQTFNWDVVRAGNALARSSSSMLYMDLPAGDQLWVVNPDNDTVSVLDLSSDTKVLEIPVGKAPQNLSLVGTEVWVVNRDSADITIIDASSMSTVETMALPAASAPYAVVADELTLDVYVTLSASGTLLKVDGPLRSVSEELDLGRDIRAISIDQTGSTLYVSRFVTPPLPEESTATPITNDVVTSYGGEVLVVDTGIFGLADTIILQHSEALDTRVSGRGIPNYLGAVSIMPSGDYAWVPSKQDNIKRGSIRDGFNLNHENSVRAVASKLDLNSQSEILADRVDLDDASMATSVLFEPSEAYMFAALETTGKVAMIELATGTEAARFTTGLAPRSLAISPDAEFLYVHNFMDRTVTKHNVGELINNTANDSPALATYSLVANEALAAEVLLGKQLFYDAGDDRLAREDYLSCASCHADGSHDGRVWDFTGFGEGVRNTISLRGRAGTAHGPLHWSGNFDEVQDFEGQIRSFAEGSGLMSDMHFLSGTLGDPLGDPKAGLSADLDALAAYITSLDSYDASPYRDQDTGLLTETAIQGQNLFAEKGCSSCHSGTTFTDSALEVFHDIGTLGALSGNRSSGPLTGLDTPTLKGVWSTAPYLHDGSALTLEDAISAHTSISVSEFEMIALVEYLKQLDGNETSAPAFDDWVFCASEGTYCDIEGVKEVRYGAAGLYNSVIANEGVYCKNSVFGDPVALPKSCFVRVTGNNRPWVAGVSDRWGFVNGIVALQIEAIDAEGLPMSFAATSLPAGLSIDPDSGLIYGVISAAGGHLVDIQVTDSEGDTSTISFNWEISEWTATTEWVQCAEEGDYCNFGGTRDIRFGADPEFNVQTHTNGVMCKTNVFGDPTPGVGKGCYYSISGNTAPSITAVEDKTSGLNVTSYLPILATDVDNDDLAFFATGLPTGASIDPSTGVILSTLTEEGVYNVQVFVGDGNGGSDSISFVWTVDSEFDNSELWSYCAAEGELCTFEGIREVRFRAFDQSLSTISDSSVNCNASAFGGDPVPGFVKICEYRIAGNNPPYLENPGAQYSSLNSSVSLTLNSYDPEDGNATLVANGLPDGLVFDGATGTISGTVDLEGTYSVQVTATDSEAFSSEVNFNWTVLSPPEGGENLVWCAFEGDSCSFTGEKKVFFGANEAFNSGYFLSSVLCKTSSFGDPAPGVAKSCYIDSDPVDTGWTECASATELCFFEGTKLVRYGAYGAYSYRIATNSVYCGGDYFGNPIGGEVLKRCEVQDLPSDYDAYPEVQSEAEQWVFCAPNDLTCHFPGTKQVRYRLGDDWVETTATDSIACTAVAFGGDPVTNKQQEYCEVRLNRAEAGEWSPVQNWPLVAVHASLLPNGLILTHNATNDDEWPGYTNTGLWNPSTLGFQMLDVYESTLSEVASELFCTGFDLLPDGSLLFTGSEPNVGGDNDLNATRYDFRGERFSRVADTNHYRYYPSLTAMPTGDMVTFAGTASAAPLEIFKFNGAWDELSGTDETYLNDFSYYAWGQTAPNGQLFYPGPAPDMRYFDLNGEGVEILAGTRDALDRDYGSYALYDIGKMFITGGAKPATNSTVLIDINGPSPVVTAGPDMGMPRRHGNLTILADGTLLETGGHTGSVHQDFEPDKAVFSAEIWNPESGNWTTMASMQVNRLYHSTSVLLPDGRVISGGTGYPFDLIYNEANAEIFSPPYLFNADGTLASRPSIVESPESVGYDHNFTVTVGAGETITKAHLVKLGTVTHHQNFGQRLVPLEFSQSGESLSLTSPESGSIAPPGYYMLFVVNATGTPSVAKFVRVLPDPAVTLLSAVNSLALDIEDGSMNEHASLSVSFDSSELSQVWSMQRAASGYFKFISRASGYVLTNNAGNLEVANDQGLPSQEWVLSPSVDGYYSISSADDGLVLSVSPTADLTLEFNTGDLIATSWQVLPTGEINMVSAHSGETIEDLDVDVATAPDHGYVSQSWYFEPTDDGYSTIRRRDGSKVLALDENGIFIIQENFTGAHSQQWRLVLNSDGSFKIESRENASDIRVLDLAVIADSGAPSNEDAWRFAPAVSGQPDNTNLGGGQLIYRALVDGIGWMPWLSSGLKAGASDLSSVIKTVEFTANGIRHDLSVNYEVYDEITGWTAGSDGQSVGAKAQAIYGMKMSLSGDHNGCDIKYRVHLQGLGWQAEAGANVLAGSEGQSSPVTGFEASVVCNRESVTAGQAAAELTIMKDSTNINNSAFDSFSYVLDNNSSGGQQIVRVSIDITTAILPDLLWDPAGTAGDTEPACFSSQAGFYETGAQVYDACITPFLQYSDGGYQIMEIEFIDFDPGETIEFGADVDPSSMKGASGVGKSGSISGLELSGSTVTIEFDDGTILSKRVFSDGSVGGGQACFAENLIAAPSLSIDSLPELPTSTSIGTHVLNIMAPPNSTVRIGHQESALFAVNGNNIDPFESNSVIEVYEYSVQTDSSGFAQLSIDLSRNSVLADPGYNLIQAAVVANAQGCTGEVTTLDAIYFE